MGGYTIAGIKVQTTAQGKKMTKVEAYERAWDLAMKGDFSLVDQIYHPDYKSFDLRTGIYANTDVLSFYGDQTEVPPLSFSSAIKDMKALLHNA